MSAIDIDILDPDLYVQGVPHDRFERLRREAPVYWHNEPDGPGFWAVTRHRDVLEVAKDAATYSSQMGGVQIPDFPEGDLRVSPDNLAVMDPPRHSRFRALVSSAFTPSALQRSEDHVCGLVSGLMDEVCEKNRFDFMTDFAEKLPTTLILKMVGVPLADQDALKRWVGQLLTPDDPEHRASPEERTETMRIFMEYAHGLAADRRRSPQDDLLSRLMEAEIDGVKLTYEEFGMFFILLLAAGTHSTQLALGSAVQLLLEHPDQRRRLIEDGALVASAVEEVLRYSPPIMHFRRTATRDTAIRGQNVSAGQKVVMWFTSACRDEDVFVRPHMFDIARAPNDHVSFGHGPHFCMGNALARMQIRRALLECVRRMPEMELDGQVERLRSNWFNGPKRLPVRAGRVCSGV